MSDESPAKRRFVNPITHHPSLITNYFPEETMDMPKSTDKIIAKKDGAIGWIIINNPEKRNAMSLEMSQAMGATLEDYGRNPAIRVGILRGAGDKSFISGANVSQFKE